MISPIIENWTRTDAIQSLDNYCRHKLIASRMKTFRNSSFNEKTINEALGSGLYYVPELKMVACFSCGIRISEDCVEESKVNQLHHTFSPGCPYLNWNESSLDALIWDGIHTTKYFAQGLPNLNVDLSVQPFRQTSKVEKHGDSYKQTVLQDFVINPDKVYQLYQISINRRFSFSSSSLSEKAINWLVDSGFFWLKYKRVVQCAFCRWAFDSKRPLSLVLEHKKLNPRCPYMSKEKFDIERNFCCVCLTQSPKYLYQPCNHLCCCVSCDEALTSNESENDDERTTRYCPICRSVILNKILCLSP